jgi:hypothetical protein
VVKQLRLQVQAWLAVQKHLILTLTERLMMQKHRQKHRQKHQQKHLQKLLLLSQQHPLSQKHLPLTQQHLLSQKHLPLTQRLLLKHQLSNFDLSGMVATLS